MGAAFSLTCTDYGRNHLKNAAYWAYFQWQMSYNRHQPAATLWLWMNRGHQWAHEHRAEYVGPPNVSLLYKTVSKHKTGIATLQAYKLYCSVSTNAGVCHMLSPVVTNRAWPHKILLQSRIFYHENILSVSRNFVPRKFGAIWQHIVKLFFCPNQEYNN